MASTLFAKGLRISNLDLPGPAKSDKNWPSEKKLVWDGKGT